MTEIIVLAAASIVAFVFIFKAWTYYDNKKEQAGLEADKILNNAQTEADKIIKTATQQNNARLQEIKISEENLKKKRTELFQYELELDQKRANLIKDREAIEKKIARQNEFINKIKLIIMSDKKYKYDLQKWLRKIFMENEL